MSIRISSRRSARSLFIIFFFFSILGIEAIAQGVRPEWKGTIRRENGRRIVENPALPVFGEIVFDLKEDLVIGNDAQEDSLLELVYQMDIDSRGNLFVLDGKAHKVHKFDDKGRLLLSFGRWGQGPGEFGNPDGIGINGADEVSISHDRKISIFDNNGVFIKSIPMPVFLKFEYGLRNFYVDRSYCTFGSGYFIPDEKSAEGIMDAIVKIDATGKIVKFLSTCPNSRREMIDYPNSLDVSTPYTPYLILTDVEEGLYVYGLRSDYRLLLADSSGAVSLEIRKAWYPELLTGREKDAVITSKQNGSHMNVSRSELEKACQFPKYKPVFDNLLADDLCRIYVQLFRSDEDTVNKAAFKYDLFDKDGRYLYRVKIPLSGSRLMIMIWRGFLYMRSDEGASLVKYKITNWDQLKNLPPLNR